MKRYDSYKGSGVEWIGEIPSHWKLKKIKHHSDVNVGLVINPSTYYDDNGEIPIITGKNVSTTGIDISKVDRITSNSNELLYKTQIHTGDLVSMRVGYPGRSSVVKPEEDGYNCCSLIITRKSSTILPYLLNYIINSSLGKIQVELCQGGMGQQVVNLSDWNEFIIPTTSISEQKQIVSFLDTKTSLIDSLIEKTQRKIELIKEKRTSLINEVVTKGLNPNVEMKDSGVEWIGEIPIHWFINKVGNNTYVKGRIGWKGLRSEDFKDKGPYLITGTDFNKDGTINWDKMYHVDQWRYDEDPFIQLQDNDVLITKDGTIGKVVYVGNLKGQTCLNSGIFHTRPTNNEYISRFFFWSLNSNVFKVLVDYTSGGSTIQHLYQNVFVNFKFPIPPISEQQQIVEYLDEQTGLIDKTISIEEKRIELLKEYRQSLISEVITGKRKVV